MALNKHEIFFRPVVIDISPSFSVPLFVLHPYPILLLMIQHKKRGTYWPLQKYLFRQKSKLITIVFNKLVSNSSAGILYIYPFYFSQNVNCFDQFS